MTNDIKAMTDIELSKHAMTLSKWRWCPGMRVLFADGSRARVILGYDGELKVCGESLGWVFSLGGFLSAYSDVRPDLSDPATLGCIRAIIGELNGHGTFEVPEAYAVMFHPDALREYARIFKVPEAALAPMSPQRKLARALVMELSSFDADDEEETRR